MENFNYMLPYTEFIISGLIAIGITYLLVLYKYLNDNNIFKRNCNQEEKKMKRKIIKSLSLEFLILTPFVFLVAYFAEYCT